MWKVILNIVIEVVEVALPFIASTRRKRQAHELRVASMVIKQLTKELPPEEKGRAIESAVNELHIVKNLKKSARKKLDKAKDRLYKKLF